MNHQLLGYVEEYIALQRKALKILPIKTRITHSLTHSLRITVTCTSVDSIWPLLEHRLFSHWFNHIKLAIECLLPDTGSTHSTSCVYIVYLQQNLRSWMDFWIAFMLTASLATKCGGRSKSAKIANPEICEPKNTPDHQSINDWPVVDKSTDILA